MSLLLLLCGQTHFLARLVGLLPFRRSVENERGLHLLLAFVTSSESFLDSPSDILKTDAQSAIEHEFNSIAYTYTKHCQGKGLLEQQMHSLHIFILLTVIYST